MVDQVLPDGVAGALELAGKGGVGVLDGLYGVLDVVVFVSGGGFRGGQLSPEVPQGGVGPAGEQVGDAEAHGQEEGGPGQDDEPQGLHRGQGVFRVDEGGVGPAGLGGADPEVEVPAAVQADHLPVFQGGEVQVKIRLLLPGVGAEAEDLIAVGVQEEGDGLEVGADVLLHPVKGVHVDPDHDPAVQVGAQVGVEEGDGPAGVGGEAAALRVGVQVDGGEVCFRHFLGEAVGVPGVAVEGDEVPDGVGGIRGEKEVAFAVVEDHLGDGVVLQGVLFQLLDGGNARRDVVGEVKGEELEVIEDVFRDAADAVQLEVQGGHGLVQAAQGVGDDLVLINLKEVAGNENTGGRQRKQEGEGIREKITVKDSGALSVHPGLLLSDGLPWGFLYCSTNRGKKKPQRGGFWVTILISPYISSEIGHKIGQFRQFGRMGRGKSIVNRQNPWGVLE